MKTVRTVAVWLFMIVVTPIVYVLFVPWTLLGNPAGFIWWSLIRFWAWAFAKLCGVHTVRTRGLERLKEMQACIVMANHESNLDPLLLVMISQWRPIRFLAKKVLFSVPFFGWALFAMDFIPIDRKNIAAVSARIRALSAERHFHRSIVIFPEGHRSRTGSLGPFLNGGFEFARATRLPILPAAFSGTREILPSGGGCQKSGDVVLVVGEPVPSGSYATRALLKEKIRADISELRDQAREMSLQAAGT